MRDTKGKNAPVAQDLSLLPNVDVVEIDITIDKSVNTAFQGVLTV